MKKKIWLWSLLMVLLLGGISTAVYFYRQANNVKSNDRGNTVTKQYAQRLPAKYILRGTHYCIGTPSGMALVYYKQQNFLHAVELLNEAYSILEKECGKDYRATRRIAKLREDWRKKLNNQ